MLKEVSGDILLTDCQTIAHGVAPNDHFDSGLALTLRETYPSMAKDFRHFCKIAGARPGDAWMWGSADGKRIVNLMTQEPAHNDHGHPGHATEHNVGHALKALAKIIKDEKLSSVALPRLASGVGKLDWAHVKPLIEKHLGEMGIPIIIYSNFIKGKKADEGL